MRSLTRAERRSISRGATRFRCRICAGLAHTSQRLAPLDRLAYRARVLATRLDAEWEPLGLPPEKPKAMHWRTYDRCLAALEEVEEAWNELWLGLLTRLLKQTSRNWRRRIG